jgi:hypothetical protein
MRASRFRYHVDTDTGLPHIFGHNITCAEVEEVLTRPSEDRPGSEGSRVAIGRTGQGRCIRVIYSPDPDPRSVFVITAYELSGKPLIAYRRRLRRRPS